MDFFRRLSGVLLLALALAPCAWADENAPARTAGFDLEAFQRDAGTLRKQRKLPSKPAVERAQQRFSAAWMPRLLSAEAAGDPFAIWILHDCSAMPDLPRADLDTNCSYEPDARERAMRRLQTSAVAAEMARLQGLTERLFRTSLIDTECARDERCSIAAITKVLQELKQRIVATGILPELPVQNLCPHGGDDPSLQTLAEECQMAKHRVLAIHTLARRYLRASLDEAPLDNTRMVAHPYATLGDLELENKPARGATANAENLDFHARFYGETVHALEAMQTNIGLRQAEDPRWNALLHSVSVGLERQGKDRPKAVQPPRKKKELWFTYEDRMTQRFAGTYRGSLISDGSSHAITVLYPVARSVRGRYLVFYGEGPDAKAEMGLLGPCTTRSPDELLCIWRDRAGTGSASFAFNRRATAFKGEWSSFGSPADHFAHMDKRYWDDMTSWNGNLQ